MTSNIIHSDHLKFCPFNVEAEKVERGVVQGEEESVEREALVLRVLLPLVLCVLPLLLPRANYRYISCLDRFSKLEIVRPGVRGQADGR